MWRTTGLTEQMAALEKVHVQYGIVETSLQQFENSQATVKKIFGSDFHCVPSSHRYPSDVEFVLTLKRTVLPPFLTSRSLTLRADLSMTTQPESDLRQLADIIFTMYERPADAQPAEARK